MQGQRSNRIWRIIFGVSAAVALLLLPTLIAKLKVLRAGADSVVYEVTNVTPYGNNSSVAIVRGVVRNEGKVPFDRMNGELRLYRGDELLYACRANYGEKVPVGEEAEVELTVSNLADAKPLLSCPVKEMRYSWTPLSARFTGFGYLFTQSFGKGALPWFVICWLIIAAAALAAGIMARRTRKQEESAARENAAAGTSSYGTGSFGAAHDHEAEVSPANDASPAGRDAVTGAQQRLEQASRMESSYRSQGLTQDAERQAHFRREAFGEVLRESAALDGSDRDAFDSAKKSYEQASRFEASYRASGSAQNAENAQYRRESAYAGMLKAVAEKDGRRSSDFDSAKKSYERESLLASSYRASGSSENAAEAEHRQRLAYGNMLKNTTDLSRKEAEEYSSAQRSYEYASRQAASYRRQGLTRDAERSEHFMRMEEAKMLKVKAEAKGNGRAFEDARKDYENASRRYSEYKSQGLEADANRQKDYMERAYAKMIANT